MKIVFGKNARILTTWVIVTVDNDLTHVVIKTTLIIISIHTIRPCVDSGTGSERSPTSFIRVTNEMEWIEWLWTRPARVDKSLEAGARIEEPEGVTENDVEGRESVVVSEECIR